MSTTVMPPAGRFEPYDPRVDEILLDLWAKLYAHHVGRKPSEVAIEQTNEAFQAALKSIRLFK